MSLACKAAPSLNAFGARTENVLEVLHTSDTLAFANAAYCFSASPFAVIALVWWSPRPQPASSCSL